MTLIGIYGSSGFGREVMPLVRKQNHEDNSKYVFVDDNLSEDDRILTFAEFCDIEHADKAVTIAIADGRVRERLAKRCEDAGFSSISVRAETAVLLDNVELGIGSILCNFTHLTSDIRIGKYFHCNIYSYVAHDCVIGDFVTFAPGVKCNGNVHIDDHAYIGTGAILKQGTPAKPLQIGRGAIVGMGAVVTKDVEPGAVVVGNPARPLER